jgi:hypothetical protein
LTPAVESSQVLRVAAAWGTTIVGAKLLEPGQDCVLGDASNALAPHPDALQAPEMPLRAVGSGWELDARGALSGVLRLRGRDEDVLGLGRGGAPVPVVPGDYGLIQYGLFSVFFQYTSRPPAMGKRHSRLALPFIWLGRALLVHDPLSGLSLFSSLVFHLGLMGLLIVNWTPPDYRLPPELVSPEEYAALFGLKRVLPEMEPAAPKNDGGGAAKGPKDPGRRTRKSRGADRRSSEKKERPV